MSPTQVIQSLYAAFGQGDVPTIVALCTDDVEWTHHGTVGLPYMRTLHGKAALPAWFGQVAESDGIQMFEPREFLEGPGHVTVLGWERTKALPDGDVFESPWIHVFTLRNGLVSRFVGLYDTAAALRARATMKR